MQPVPTPSPLLNSDHELFKELSPAISYHLRKMLRQNYDRLTGDRESGGAAKLPGRSLMASQVLAQGAHTYEITSTKFITEVEQLVMRHQTLGGQGVKYRQELRKTEQQIFELLGFSLPDVENTNTILIIDDTPENLRLLSSALIQQGYEVRNAINGPLALSRAQAIKPDLILLDVMMPGMDGYEVCRRLKENPQTRDIPIIFISALDAVIDKVTAFSVGGVDYIMKPFQIEEVLARIEHQLRIWTLQRRLEEQNMRLQQEIQDRQATEERYRTLVENTIDGIFQTTTDGHLMSANGSLSRILGYDSPQTLMRELDNVANLYAEPRRRSDFMAEIKKNGEVHQFESQVKRRDGKLIWITENARAVLDSLGGLLHYEGLVKDITEIKAASADRQKRKQYIRQLLLSLFPKSVAKQILNQGQSTLSRSGEGMVLWVNWGALTQIWLNSDPDSFIPGMADLVGRCDHLAESYGIEHTQVRGNIYLAVAGFPQDQADPGSRLANFALAIQQILRQLPLGLNDATLIRMAINQGQILAGVVGDQKLRYEVWGSAIDGAQQLCDESLPGKVQLSDRVAQSIKGTHRYEEIRKTGAFEPRGRSSFWLEGRK
jgi:adenylate cyclase